MGRKREFAAVADNTRVVNVKPLSGYRKGVLCYKSQDCLKEVVEKEGVVESKNIIKKGDQGKIVEEINIRLSGFGGGVPSDKFDNTTETKIKNFQRDYMGMEKPTGVLDEETAKGIDEFANEYGIDFDDIDLLKCKCGICNGFGKRRHKGEYSSSNKIEANYKYEYPGIHRSLLWGVSALRYHLEYSGKMVAQFYDFSSGYRCHNHEQTKKSGTTNHMGKAVDIRFKSKINGKWERPTEAELRNKTVEAVRKLCTESSILCAQYKWPAKDKFSMETTAQGAKTWVHIDVREYSTMYLDDKFFCQSVTGFKGESMQTLLRSEKK